MGRPTNAEIANRPKGLSRTHYVQFDKLREYVDISQDVLDELVKVYGEITVYKLPHHRVHLYCLEEVQAYIREQAS